MKKVLSALACLCMLIALVGCGGSSSDNSNTLVVAKENDIESLDLLKASSGMDFEVLSAFTEGLTAIDADSQVIPGLAEKWDVSDDQTVYTFHLRDAKWANGDAVTANDFVYSWQRSAAQAEDYRYFFSDDMACILNGSAITSDEMEASELGIKALDEKTVEVTLSKPTPYFLSLMSFPTAFPLNQKFVEEQGDKYATSADTVLACGPYVLSNYVKGSKLEFSKNDEYWDADAVSLDGITMNIVKEASTSAMDFDSGNTDMAKINSSLVDKYKDTETYQNILEGYLWFLQFNMEDSTISNAKIRKALSLAIDRSDLTDNVLKDGSIPARGFVPSQFTFGPDGKDYVETAENYISTDVEQAKQLFAQGLAELGVSSLEINLLHETSDPAKPAAEFIQSELTQNLPGLTVTLTGVEKETRTQRQEDGDFQVTLTRWGPDYADPTTYLALMGDNFFNYGKFTNSAYTNKLAEISSATDIEARWQACKDAEAILFEDSNYPVAPLFQVGGAILVNTDVSGVEVHTFGTPYIYKNAKKAAK